MKNAISIISKFWRGSHWAGVTREEAAEINAALTAPTLGLITKDQAQQLSDLISMYAQRRDAHCLAASSAITKVRVAAEAFKLREQAATDLTTFIDNLTLKDE